MKDHEGYLSKGWMMHPPYDLRNGTPALAIYTYLYRTTRKNEWQGSMQTLADLVEIPQVTVRKNLHLLESRGLVSIKPLAYSHYSIKAQRLTIVKDEVDIRDKVVDTRDKVVDIKEKVVDICEQPIKDNNKYNINIKETNSSSSIEAAPAPSPAADDGILDRKVYIARVLSRSLPEYPYAVVYEYASLVQIPSEVVDDFLTHYASTGWKMNNGGRVENWAAALMNWFKRAKRFAERDAARAAAMTVTGYQAGKFTQRGLSLLCKNEQMSPQNRAIYEAEQEQKHRLREQQTKEKESALSWDEYQATKFTKK